MDANWCLFCEKHIRGRSAAYCSNACLRRDTLRAAAGSSPATKEHLPLKRRTLASVKVSYPSCTFGSCPPALACSDAAATKIAPVAYTPGPTVKMHRTPLMAPT